MATTWQGEKECDLCLCRIRGWLFDAATRSGAWATMCEDCFQQHARGLGTGLGQKYVQRENDVFVKVAG